MKKFLISAFLFFSPLLGLAEESKSPRILTARITFYNGREDQFGKVTKMGGKAIEGETAAVDPRKIPFLSIIKIPALKGIIGDGSYLAVDTGRAVRTRKAAINMAEKLYKDRSINQDEYESYKNALVIDIFVDLSTKEMGKLASKVPYYIRVEIYPRA